MCYSAEAWSLYNNYTKEFGADIDMREFWILYLDRDEAYRTKKKAIDTPKIPKGMDLNFLHPKTELEEKIKALIDAWDERKISESEQEMFKQAKRLADAERKLAVKETKTALNEQRIATNKIAQMKRWIADAKRDKHNPAKEWCARCATTAGLRAWILVLTAPRTGGCRAPITQDATI